MTQAQIREGARTGTEFAEKSTKAIEGMPLSGFWFGALGAMIVSAILFVAGKRRTSLFVGLWVPSIISLALFYKLLHPSDEVRKARHAAGTGNF
ncbi:MAG TPA: hypothetical protein VFZ12_05495 [Dehalococcoidia bacterium]|nr:hypothetical protein [Dehalococcoidia bacterium]